MLVPRYGARLATAIAAVGLAIAIVVASVAFNTGQPPHVRHAPPHRHGLSTAVGSYIGVYSRGVPISYARVEAFATATGVRPNVVSYYSGWLEPFQASFAATAAFNGAVPLVQMNPADVSIAAIAAGRYDSYLRGYALAVRTYRHPVILSFGHEMNGYWYSWGHTHTSSRTFVAAWRHIISLFRKLRVQNATWLWTVNTIHKNARVPSPEPWWPGNSYVDWVGIDGYFTNSSSVFASVFGPTIVNVRTYTHDPIFISETSVAPVARRPAKITNLFAGIHLYGLLGFIWFNSVDKVDWRLSSPAAITAFRRSAKKYQGAVS